MPIRKGFCMETHSPTQTRLIRLPQVGILASCTSEAPIRSGRLFIVEFSYFWRLFALLRKQTTLTISSKA